MLLISSLLSILTVYSNSAVLSSSQLETCDRSSSSSMQCSQKLVITLSLDQSLHQSQEQLKVQQFKDGSSSSNENVLKKPIIIDFEKSATYSIYPLLYKQSFYSRPIEKVISSSVLSCKDGFNEDQPTCGFQYNSQNQKIIDSQGFCCKCAISDIIGIGMDDDIDRGKLCRMMNIGSGSATAHCLAYETQEYQSYQIQQYYLYYQIDIIVRQLETNSSETIRIGSNSLIQQKQNIIAQLVGSFQLDNPSPSLNHLYLFKPNNNLRQYESINNWLLFDANMITFDGTECNKIGVGYSAFKHQSNRCNQQIGSCILNQIEDYYQMDIKNRINSQQLQYMLEKYGTFQAMQNGHELQLIYKNVGTASSLIRIELNADNLQYIRTVGNASIDYLEVSNFTASSSTAKVLIQITNLSPLPNKFGLSTSCSKYIVPINSQHLQLQVMQSQTLRLELQTTVNSKEMQHNCYFEVVNSIGQYCDSKNATFQSSQLINDNRQLENNTNTNQNGQQQMQQPFKQSISCEQICGFYDLLCQIGNQCGTMIFKFIMTIVGIFGGFTGIFLLCKFINKKRRDRKNQQMMKQLKQSIRQQQEYNQL